jgi:hypothetical protein
LDPTLIFGFYFFYSENDVLPCSISNNVSNQTLTFNTFGWLCGFRLPNYTNATTAQSPQNTADFIKSEGLFDLGINRLQEFRDRLKKIKNNRILNPPILL